MSSNLNPYISTLLVVFIFIINCLVTHASSSEIQKGTFIGCYKELSDVKRNEVETPNKASECIDICTSKYFRYTLLKNEDQCSCGNFLGEFQDPGHCAEFCKNCESKESLVDVFITAVLKNGPPRNFQITNITDSKAHLSWTEPENPKTIDHYKVVANIISTYSRSKLLTYAWMYSNDTFKVGLVSLHPGTRYNITVQAVSPDEEGAPTFKVIDTKIGDPDMVPKPPTVIKREPSKMLIKIEPVVNNNGPVSSYLIIVIDADSVQAVQTENLKPYRQATSEGYSYYVTAEIQPQRVNDIFTIGDGKVYGKYYNAPLPKEGAYHVMVGMVSRTQNSEIVVYSETGGIQTDVVMTHVPNYQADSSSTVIILSLGIVFISLLLVAGLISFYLLRNRVEHRHRQRLTDNQELTIQGPMIDVENNGYIPDEELGHSSSTHYQRLNEQVWTIPRNLLNIEHTVFLGVGKYGRIHGGSVTKNDQLIPVSVYSIADKKLTPSERKSMLLDLDLLIKCSGHRNVIDLIGTCESVDTTCVILEECNAKEPSNLKDYLLSARSQNGHRFSAISESKILDLMLDVCKGMEYLHDKRVIHKSLCSMHIAMIGGTAKISGFGLSKFYKTERTPNYFRYIAKEVLRGAPYTVKSDVWAFGCILWEISCLGGTLYSNIANDDVSDKIIKGLLLSQLSYVYDPLYQVMLNCWQIDIDERPSFAELRNHLEMLSSETFVNFNTFPGFQFEPFIPDFEFTKMNF